jgi:hypothetical protein
MLAVDVRLVACGMRHAHRNTAIGIAPAPVFIKFNQLITSG